ncbi:hypothetical protein HY285_04885 [Candidatus Peregrinibacteria bacterium]|nr:hypothetical protein [Candidatus Peregrinibacteria bacterium]MBI3816846.1 hypothetical protein [Candidatus Peregrinibacteria bacterium]
MKLDQIASSETTLLRRKKEQLEGKRDDPRRVRKGKTLAPDEETLLRAIEEELGQRLERERLTARHEVGNVLNPQVAISNDSETTDDPTVPTRSVESSERLREKALYPLMVANLMMDDHTERISLQKLRDDTKTQLMNDRLRIAPIMDVLDPAIAIRCETINQIYQGIRVTTTENGESVRMGVGITRATLHDLTKEISESIAMEIGTVMPSLSPEEFLTALIAISIRCMEKIIDIIEPGTIDPRIFSVVFLTSMLRHAFGKLPIPPAEKQAAFRRLLQTQNQNWEMRRPKHAKDPLNDGEMHQFGQSSSHYGNAIGAVRDTFNNFEQECANVEIAHGILSRFPHGYLPSIRAKRNLPHLIGTYGWKDSDNGVRFSETKERTLSLIRSDNGNGITASPDDVQMTGNKNWIPPLSFPSPILEKTIAIKENLPRLAGRMQRMLEILCPQWKEQEELLRSCIFVEFQDFVHILYPGSTTKPQLPGAVDEDSNNISATFLIAGINAADKDQWSAMSVPSLRTLESRLLHSNDVEGIYLSRERQTDAVDGDGSDHAQEGTPGGRRTSMPRLACLHKVLLQQRESAEFAWDTDGADTTDTQQRDYSTIHHGHHIVVTLPQLSLQFILNDDSYMAAFFTRQPRGTDEYVGRVNSKNMRTMFNCRRLHWESEEQFERAIRTLIEEQRSTHRTGVIRSEESLLDDPQAIADFRTDIEGVAGKLGKQPWEVTMPDMRKILSGEIAWRWLDTVECGDTYVRRLVNELRSRLEQIRVASQSERQHQAWGLVLKKLYPTEERRMSVDSNSNPQR